MKYNAEISSDIYDEYTIYISMYKVVMKCFESPLSSVKKYYHLPLTLT